MLHWPIGNTVLPCSFVDFERTDLINARQRRHSDRTIRFDVFKRRVERRRHQRHRRCRRFKLLADGKRDDGDGRRFEIA